MDSVLFLLIIVIVTMVVEISTIEGYSQSNRNRGWSGNNRQGVERGASSQFDPDRVVFPDEMAKARKKARVGNRRETEPIKNTTTNELPLSLAMRLNELDDIFDFLEEFVENKDKYHNDKEYDTPVSIALGTRFGSGTKSNKGFSSKPVCSPVPTTVRLAPKVHPTNVLYLPECAHVKRCSGCCNTELLTCQPLKTMNVTFKVYENLLLPSKNKLRYSKSFDVEVIEHLSCGCRCRVQAHHCQETQRYESQSCRCVCKEDGNEGREACEAYGKIWDQFTCSCNCPEHTNTDCSTGTEFDGDSCACF